MLRRSETTDRLVVILLVAMAVALILAIPSLGQSGTPEANTENQTNSEILSGTDVILQTGVTSELSEQSQADGGQATNKTTINIDTNLSADVTVNGEEITMPADGDINDSVVTDDGNILNLSINSNFTDGDDLDIDIDSESNIKIKNDTEYTIEVDD